MNPKTILILACAAIVLAAIGKINRASGNSQNADVILNATTLSFIGGVGIAILLALAVLSIGN